MCYQGGINVGEIRRNEKLAIEVIWKVEREGEQHRKGWLFQMVVNIKRKRATAH